MKNRKKKIRGHATHRAASRYGISYTKNDRDNIVAIIQLGETKNGKLFSMYRIKSRRFKCNLKYREIELLLIYDSCHKEVMTFLSKD